MITTLFMILIVAMVLTRLLGVSSCSNDHRLRWGGRDGRFEVGGWDRAGRGEDRVAVRRQVERAGERHRANEVRAASSRVETPLERLQREFAQGSITVDQYEREVGKLYGVRSDQ